MSIGTLFLIPSCISNEFVKAPQTTSPDVIEALNALEHLVMETPKTGRAFIRSVIQEYDFQSKTYHQLNKYSSAESNAEIIHVLNQGTDVGFLSDAGLPCVADPGNTLVALAHKNNIPVVPLSGPSSITLALMASGFNGQRFEFIGYLPKEEQQLKKELLRAEAEAKNLNKTTLFIETPFRSDKTLEKCLNTLASGTEFLVAGSLFNSNEIIGVKSVSEWKKSKPNLHKIPCIFGIGNSAQEEIKAKSSKRR